MCGIFGLAVDNNEFNHARIYRRVMDKLFLLSESRGKEAAGCAYLNRNSIYVVKSPESASKFIKKKKYSEIFNKVKDDLENQKNNPNSPNLCLIGHSRLVTNGGQQLHDNNQPAIADSIVAIHNGIITNCDDLWLKHKILTRKSKLDTEIFLRLIRFYYKNNNDLIKSLQMAYSEIEGSASIAALFSDLDCLLLSTDNGSLYLSHSDNGKNYIFASEKYILETLLKDKLIRTKFSRDHIKHIRPGQGLIINLRDLSNYPFSIRKNKTSNLDLNINFRKNRKIYDISDRIYEESINQRIPGEGPYFLPKSFVDDYPKNKKSIDKLQRCTKCVLPATMPYIDFDENGICNYCRHYATGNSKGFRELQKVVAPFRKQDGSPDCLVTFSGGRDSSYGLHLIKKMLGLNPLSYTYDWGMVTDLARRNQMRICGKLGIEHILVSADLAKKRRNIKLNVLAWLKNPHLGTIPLFMAGDKQYFYYANKISKQSGCENIIICGNPLETTNFKIGYCGIPPRHKRTSASLSILNQLKLAGFYLKQFLINTAYLNRSLLDTVGAFASYYLIPHNYINIYKYVEWNEEIIINTLKNEYNWEVAEDTESTWRIGDGTAAFYNYIYYTLGGVTENDTFRSNQIREGMITRDKAMILMERDNKPRYDSIQWYCDIIGIDFIETMQIINNAKKNYPTE